MLNDMGRNGKSLWPLIAAGIALLLALSVGSYLFFREAAPPELVEGLAEEPVSFAVATSLSGPTINYKLYFPSPEDGYLRAEPREISIVSDPVNQMGLVVGELIRGPHTGLVPTFPEDTRVKNIFVDHSGIAYVNFTREIQTGFPGGAWTETLTIYSLTNTLSLNFEDIDRVQILVEGREVETLAGHIDTSEPFKPREGLIR
jgi:spore germination protein GerM